MSEPFVFHKVIHTTRENPTSFEELHDLLIDFENYLKSNEPQLDSIATAYATQNVKHNYYKRALNLGTTQTIHPLLADPHHPIQKKKLFVSTIRKLDTLPRYATRSMVIQTHQSAIMLLQHIMLECCP